MGIYSSTRQKTSGDPYTKYNDYSGTYHSNISASFEQVEVHPVKAML